MSPRVTRSRASLVPAPAAAPVPLKAARAAPKRKQRSAPLREHIEQQHDDKENTLDAAAAMRLVTEAYEHTLAQKQQEVKALAHELDVLTIDKRPAAVVQPSPRRALQPRDTNQRPATPTNASINKPLVLSPRTLLVPSTLPTTTNLAVAVDLDETAESAAESEFDSESDLDASFVQAAPTPAPLLAPVTSPLRKLDAAHSLPAPYVTINPDMLREAAWNFRDLQLLCMRLGLGGRGTRDQLVERLLAWHRKCFRKKEADEEEEEEDDHPLSIRKRMKYASNFSLLQFDTSAMMQASAAPAPVEAAPTTPPLSPIDAHANAPLASVTVSSSLPQLLTPLLYRTARRPDGTPRSILSPSMRPKSAKRLSFSVFNGVKLIPSRTTSNEEELNATPSPTKTLRMDEADEDATSNHAASVAAPPASIAAVPSVVAPPRPSFLSTVSSAIMNALSPRKSAPSPSAFSQPSVTLPSTLPSYSSYSHSSGTSSHFTFDRLPSIESRHGDESESDLSMEISRDETE